LLLAGTTLAVMLPLSLERPWWIWTLTVAALPVGAWLIAVERRVVAGGGRPALDLRPLTDPTARWSLLAFAGTSATYIALLFLLSVYAQDQLRLPAWQAGLLPLGWVLAFGLGGPTLARSRQAVARRLPVLGCCLLALAYALAPTVPTGRGAAMWPLMLVLCFGGYGLGVTQTALLNLLTTAVPPRFAATLSATVNTLSTVAGVLGVAVFGSLYPWLAARHWAGPSAAWATACAGLALISAGSAFAASRASRSALTTRPVPAAAARVRRIPNRRPPLPDLPMITTIRPGEVRDL
jgi:hypothetical protein